MREKYAETLASKAEEIRTLKSQLADMENLAVKLKDENRKLRAELEKLRNQVNSETCHPSPVVPQFERERSHRYDERERNRRHDERERSQNRDERERSGSEEGKAREVYLGRVNSKGIFVRADRHAVDGQSIYKLTTYNGVSGSFTLLKNPLIEEQMLDDPGRWLAGGCFAKDIFDTEGRERIKTETPGTAVFRDGAWRVEKKARIRYE